MCDTAGVWGERSCCGQSQPQHAGSVPGQLPQRKHEPVEFSYRQAALLPLASPSSGIILTWDPEATAFVSSADSLGPIFGERADTIGKHRVFLGFAYQYFNFNSLDGLSLKALQVVLTQPDFVLDGTTCSISAPDTNPAPPSNLPSRTGDCSFIRDVITTSNRIDLKIHQFTTFITFGLTSRIDISIAIPVENVRMGIFSLATIVHNEDPTTLTHAFPPTLDCPATCLTQLFSNVGAASGIGDMTLRIKGTAWKGERAALALGADIRMPTGDQFEFPRCRDRRRQTFCGVVLSITYLASHFRWL